MSEAQADSARELLNRGNALHARGLEEEALSCYDAALKIRSDYPEALNNRGNILQALRRYDEALASYERALAIRPDFAEALNNRGNTLQALMRFDEALACYDRSLKIKPDAFSTLNNRGNALQKLHRYEESLSCYEEALAARSDSAQALSNTADVLRHLGRLPEAIAKYRRALELKPDLPSAHSNLIFALDLMEGGDTRLQQEVRRGWFDQFARKHSLFVQPHANLPEPDRRLRIGYVSADFRLHSAASIFGPVVRGHDPAGFEVFCYSDVKREDEITAGFRRSAQVWKSTVGMSDESLAGQIRGDAIDILVDLSGHTAGNRLLTFARKPAPVQVTAWGYLTGTGMPTIDYLLADPVLIPAEERPHYAEKVLDLPCCVCYGPPEYLPEVSMQPAMGGKSFTFGCLNRLEKITGRTIALWGRILAALPESRILVKGPGLDDGELRRRFIDRLQGVGIERGRVQLLGASPHLEHLHCYNNVNLVLDPSPHGGGVSTLDALWMGVPVVSLQGPTLTSRLSAAILTAMQMGEWIARTEEEYVRIAVEAARAPSRLAELRKGLRGRAYASPVGNVGQYCRAVEETYRSIWRRWCAGRTVP